MKIVNLIEDNKGECKCKCEHGFSCYIETTNHKILFDTGSTGTFIENAKKLEIDLSKVDTVILSHGHYDHCGGVLDFIKINSKAHIYMQKSAGGAYYNLKNNQEKYIGIDKALLKLPQLRLLDGDYKIDNELFLFRNKCFKEKVFATNAFLKEKVNDEFIEDRFIHEQNLVINDNNVSILISGCAHNGILNIINTYNDFYNMDPSFIIGGFHLIKDDDYNNEEEDFIKDIANELNKKNIIFYTGHCTGGKAFDIMKSIMKDKLVQIYSGKTII